MPAVKTNSTSSLPASPLVGYKKPLDLEKIFNNLHSNNNNGYANNNGEINRQLITNELAQLHSLGAELRAGLLKAVEALRLVQNNDETLRGHIETANAQTQRGISELTKVITTIQDDSNQLRSKFDSLDTSNMEMRQKISELEKIVAMATNEKSPPAVHSPIIAPPAASSDDASSNKHQLPSYNQNSAIKFRQSVLTFLTAEVHFCRTIAKMCQQQQEAMAFLASNKAGPNLPPPEAIVAASVFPTSLWQIYRVHADFLAQLESRMAKWGHWGCIGDVFLRLLDNKTSHFGDIYKLYASELISIFGAGGSPVCPPLLLPFRRLADYVAFLESTKQSLDPDHPDLYNVAKSTDKLRSLINRLNEQQLRFLLVADDVAPIGNGTAMDQIMVTNNGNYMLSKMTLNNINHKPKMNVINNGSATIARTRYTQNNKNSIKLGTNNGDLRKNGRSASMSNVMLKSRSHGDLYHQQQDDVEYCFPVNTTQQLPPDSGIMMLPPGFNNSAASDDDDDGADDGGETDGLVSPVNYHDLFEGDIQLTTRSLPRSHLNHRQPNVNPSLQQPTNPHLNDATQVVLDCWASKCAANTPTTFSATTTTPRPAAMTMAPTMEMMAELQAIPPLPHRSCETSNPSSRFYHNPTQHNRDKVAIFVSATNNGNGTISSTGSSGSGGSTSGKGPSSYQPLESMKQSLLNLFNGYKKRKRGALRGNGLMSPLTANNNHGINTPQIRIISPPSSLMEKPQIIPNAYNHVVANSNFHVDVRNSRPGSSAYQQQQQQTAATCSGNGGSTASSNMTSPPSSPANMSSLPSSVNGNSPPKRSPIMSGAV